MTEEQKLEAEMAKFQANLANLKTAMERDQAERPTEDGFPNLPPSLAELVKIRE